MFFPLSVDYPLCRKLTSQKHKSEHSNCYLIQKNLILFKSTFLWTILSLEKLTSQNTIQTHKSEYPPATCYLHTTTWYHGSKRLATQPEDDLLRSATASWAQGTEGREGWGG